MAQLVDEQVVCVCRQGLFVAFEGVITRDTGTGELHTQADANAVACAFLGFVFPLHKAVRRLAKEAAEVGFAESLVEKLL